MLKDYIKPTWAAPPHVHAYTTTRQSGFSKGAYASFNLSLQVDDNAEDVLRNRAKLREDLQFKAEPIWLKQIHSTRAVCLDDAAKNFAEIDLTADAAYTSKKELVCAVMTADCLPLLITDRKGTFVAAIHAGWKGLAAGIIEETLKVLPAKGENLLVWLGPAIGPQKFMVGDEVRQAFLKTGGKEEEVAFKFSDRAHWLCDMYQIARHRLALFAVPQDAIYGGDLCTFSDANRFYSYRRDREITGRMASLIWLD